MKRYAAEVKAAVLARCAPNSGHLTRRDFEQLETETEIPAATLKGWAAAEGMVELRKTGRRGRPPGPALTPYQRQGADAVPKIEGCKDLPESSYRLSPQEMERLDLYLARHERLGWSESFTIRLRFGD